MIEKIEDFGFDSIDKNLTPEEHAARVQQIVEEKLGVTYAEMITLCSKDLQDTAVETAKNFVVITPFEDYSKSIEDPKEMVDFLRDEAAKPENWALFNIFNGDNPKLPDMVEFCFYNKAVDEGDAVRGYVFVSYTGKVKHHFVQGDP